MLLGIIVTEADETDGNNDGRRRERRLLITGFLPLLSADG